MALTEEQRKKLQEEVNQINLKSDADKTSSDYYKIAALDNWATSSPGSYYSVNGGTGGMQQYAGVGKILGDGSYRYGDLQQAGRDSMNYYYDVRLDPRSNNGAGNAIQDLIQSANLKASQESSQGLGNYDDLLSKYYSQIGYTGDANDIYNSLQTTGTLGLKTLDGKSIEEAYKLGNYDPNSTVNYDRDYYTSGQADRDRIAARDAYNEYMESLPVYQVGGVYDGAVTTFNNNGSEMKLGGSMGGRGGNQWGYNLESDPVWQAYSKQYTREGNQAMNDAIAQLAARTGGMASSYAGQVGQQTYNDYMQQMTDKIPQLEQMAYERYQNDLDRQEAAAGSYGGYGGATESEMAANRNAVYDSIANGGSSSSSSSAKPTLTAAQTLSALKSGVVNDQTLAAYEYYYGQPWDGSAASVGGTTKSSSGGGGSSSSGGGVVGSSSNGDFFSTTMLDLIDKYGYDGMVSKVTANPKGYGFKSMADFNRQLDSYKLDNEIPGVNNAKLPSINGMTFTAARDQLLPLLDDGDEKKNEAIYSLWNEYRANAPTTYDALIKKLGDYKPKDPILTKEDWKKRHQYTKPNISDSELNQEYIKYLTNVWRSLFV